MILYDRAALDECRGIQRCEWCGRRVACEPMHVFARGLGSRIDHRLNLVAGCRECHTNSHNGARPTRDDLVALVAHREGTTPEALKEWIWQVRRTDKGQPVPAAPGRPVKPDPELDASRFEPPF